MGATSGCRVVEEEPEQEVAHASSHHLRFMQELSPFLYCAHPRQQANTSF